MQLFFLFYFLHKSLADISLIGTNDLSSLIRDNLQRETQRMANSIRDNLRTYENAETGYGELGDSMLNGVIGMTTGALADYTGTSQFSQNESKGGCRWFGFAPFCLESCPTDYDFIRSSSGRCSDNSTDCIPDASFGQPCTSFLGFELKKKFCCKSDPIDCTWSGRWMGSQDAYNIYCRYDSTVGRCGQLHCSVNSNSYQAQNTSVIEGAHCDELQMWSLRGRATCGYIAWADDEGKVTNSCLLHQKL